MRLFQKKSVLLSAYSVLRVQIIEFSEINVNLELTIQVIRHGRGEYINKYLEAPLWFFKAVLTIFSLSLISIFSSIIFFESLIILNFVQKHIDHIGLKFQIILLPETVSFYR